MKPIAGLRKLRGYPATTRLASTPIASFTTSTRSPGLSAGSVGPSQPNQITSFGKRLKVLGVSTEKRHPDYPGVPTMSESGFPGFEEYTQGLGVVGPAGLPAPVVARLNEAIRASLVKPETKEKLNKLGAITEGGSTPAEFRAWLAKDLERWERVIKTAGVKAE